MKKKLLLLIAFALLIGGGQGIYTAMQNQKPTEYNLNELKGFNMPKEKWLTLKDCNFNLTESVFFQNALGNGLAEEIYTPLHSNNDSTVVFIAQKTQGLLDVFNLINTQTDIAKRNHFIDKYKSQIFQENLTYTGLVRYGIELDQKQWRQLAGSSPKLVKNFIILDYNTAPSSGFSYVMFGLGLLLASLGIKSFMNKKEERK